MNKQKKSDGSWFGEGRDSDPIVSTSFALLFLSKGRTPVLISKLAYGDPGSQDWNNDRNDARNLVEFASQELFKKKPLAWQVFDARSPSKASGKELAAELLQSPILYITGGLKPMHFSDADRALLKEYVANGGFIFAEACCGSKGFDKEFGELMKYLFPDDQLRPLLSNHPIWGASGKFTVPAEEFPLYGIESCCKTVVVYSGPPIDKTQSPAHLSCFWERNKFDKGKGQAAFQLGANIIAYATGMEVPGDRGSKVEMVREEGGKKPPPGTLKVAQLKHGQQARDWQPAPHAMRNLMAEMENMGLKVDLDTENVSITAKDVLNFKFLYMHGRSALSFKPQA